MFFCVVGDVVESSCGVCEWMGVDGDGGGGEGFVLVDDWFWLCWCVG